MAAASRNVADEDPVSATFPGQRARLQAELELEGVIHAEAGMLVDPRPPHQGRGVEAEEEVRPTAAEQEGLRRPLAEAEALQPGAVRRPEDHGLGSVAVLRRLGELDPESQPPPVQRSGHEGPQGTLQEGPAGDLGGKTRAESRPPPDLGSGVVADLEGDEARLVVWSLAREEGVQLPARRHARGLVPGRLRAFAAELRAPAVLAKAGGVMRREAARAGHRVLEVA